MPLDVRLDLITSTKAAKMLGVHRATVLMWCGKGRLRGELVAGVPYFRYDDVVRLVAERQGAQQQAADPAA